MHILYVGYYTSDNLLYDIQNLGINNMSVARQKYETNLLEGLIYDNRIDDLHLVSYVPTREDFTVPEYSEIGGLKVKHIAINRRSFKSLLQAEKTFEKYILSLGNDILVDLHVLMYEVNPLFMIPLLRLKRKYNFKLITICAELSILRRSKRIKYQIRNKLFSYFEKKFDGYILFAKPMEAFLKCQNKPHVVIEGIAPELFGQPEFPKKNIVMYAGGLGSDNNMKLLIKACKQIDELDELWICGTGKDRSFVEEAENSFPKLHYYGMVSNDEVRELEKKAKVLLNLRSPTAIITKYSFPSKLLEYIASGTLVLSTRLEGIPEDYYEYLIPVNRISVEDIVCDIRAILTMSAKEYIEKAHAAQMFINSEKNRAIQSKKILDFVQSV